MRYAVTGVSRPLTPREENIVKLAIASYSDVTELTTGAAQGVDTVAYYAGLESHKTARHRVVVPAAPHNIEVATHAAKRGIIDHAPAGLTLSDAYMARNERMVLYADCLIAFPETITEQLRSGTWATIRRARRAGLNVEMYPLDGRNDKPTRRPARKTPRQGRRTGR